MDVAKTMSLSVVIPALDAAATLPRCLEALEEARGRFRLRFIVVDGGSRDGTRELARTLGAEAIESLPGRGAQLAAGAGASDGDWLLFLHADTVLDTGWSEEAARFLRDPANAKRAAAFRFALDDESAAARRLEAFVSWRCRVLGLAYGDQGLLLSRSFFEEIGGFRPLPLMEDVDIARRIGRRRLTLLDTPAITSAARYRREGYAARGARNLVCLMLYFAGMPPKLIARIYR
jgi:rSAM/selenodomain-associated transferase 2